VTVRVVWPEFGDERLQELIREHPDDLWRVDIFPNFITYRRQIEALKTVCIRGYNEPKPTATVRHILASLISDQNVGGANELCVEDVGSGLEESGGGLDEIATDSAQVLLPASDELKVASGHCVLPSDVVTDEAPPDEMDLTPRFGEDAVAINMQQLQLRTSSHDMPPQRKERDSKLRNQLHSDRKLTTRRDLNDSQRLAIELAVNEPLTMIQGPPGTGKTKTAAAIVKEWLEVDKTSKVSNVKLQFSEIFVLTSIKMF